MEKPEFTKLKLNYRKKSTEIHQCTMHFPNTCAIRMSEALVRTDAAFLQVFTSSSRNKCPHGNIRGAQDLAAILARPTVLGPRDLGWNDLHGQAPKKAWGKCGIVYYMNIYGDENVQDHIDLWDDRRPVGSQHWNAKTVWMWILEK